MDTQMNPRSMMLSELLDSQAFFDNLEGVSIKGISEYSADVEPGDLFIAMSGLKYAREAINKGASAIIYNGALVDENQMTIDAVIPLIECSGLDAKVNLLVNRFYGDIDETIKTVAITGTDGKSSVAHLAAQALNNTGESCGLIGTLGYGQLGVLSESTHTTPPVSRIAKEYFKFQQAGCTAVAMEASSHGIQQGRLKNVPVHTAVLTNITRDHLDYHESMEAYVQAKAGLFFDKRPKYAVLNLDDEIAAEWSLSLASSLNVITFSLMNARADVYALEVKYLEDSTFIKLSVKKQVLDVTTPLLGQFNVFNVLAVAAVLTSLDKGNLEIIEALNSLTPVPGRMQKILNPAGCAVIVDYAHTPAALLAALNAVREHCLGNLICVFGCGGDRDTGKRSEMGEIATRNSNFVFITSDNPRYEDPQEIINQITQGCESSNYKVIVDRKQAIAAALEMASANDAVLIAGKGHEKYQYIKHQKIEFDDVAVASELLAGFVVNG